MKILVDMNLSPSWVRFLDERGFEAVHWSSLGSANATDAEIMKYAEANGLVIFTHDLDFGALLAAQSTRGPSVIQIRAQDVLPGAAGEMVVRTLTSTRSYLEAGALITIEAARHRVRLLPL
jgi:predicted nuclease of predicted toxin-antitoxin system